MSDAAAVSRLVDDVVARHGRLDYMFNNAGVSMACEMRDTTLADWDRIVRVNLLGVVHGVQAAYAQMLKQGHGHIVNTGSIAGLAPFPLSVVYNTTKHAVVGLSTSLRTEAEGLGVKVSVVCPGFIDTPLKQKLGYRNLDAEASMRALPFELYSVDACASDVLKGVEQNKAVIVTPMHARALWAAYRVSPSANIWANTKAARESRKLRTRAAPPGEQLLLRDGQRYTFESIVAADPETRVEIFRRGVAPNLRDLEGCEYDGRNLSAVSRVLRIRRFIKGFVRSPAGADPEIIDGYNLWARQDDGLVKPWEPSSPKRHGFYKVYKARRGAAEDKHPHAVVFDYGLGDNGWQPSGFLRDYAVQVYPDDPGLLIGNAYVALGSRRVLGGYFVMRRRARG